MMRSSSTLRSGGARGTVPGQSRPTGRRAIGALLVVSALAYTGTRVMAIAVPWFVLVSTGSATQTGLVAAFELAPYVAVKALAGPLVDRWGQRRVSVVADLASALVVVAIPLLHHLGALHFGALLALVAVAGAVRGPGDTAKHTAVPFVAENAGLPLERITGLAGAIERGSGLVAPAMAAGMITLVGPSGAITVTAGCFLLSAVIGRVGLPAALDHAGEAAPEEPYRRRLAAGWRFLRGDRLLFSLVIMIMATNLLDVAKASVLLPVWARDTGRGVAAIGVALTCMAACSVVSSLLASWLGDRLPRRRTYFLAFAIAGPPPFLVLAMDPPLWVVALTYAVAGLASGLLNPMLGAIFFERIPRPLVGRVGALADATAWAAMPLGGLVGAGLIALAGLSWAFAIAGAAYALATVVPALAGRASFDHPRTPQSAEPRSTRPVLEAMTDSQS
jgi:MFS family permease